jgi:hypothetical protein
MPTIKYHCTVCNHGFEDSDTATRCEQGHISLLNLKKNPHLKGGGNVMNVVEIYEELKEFPNEIVVTLDTGRYIRYIIGAIS